MQVLSARLLSPAVVLLVGVSVLYSGTAGAFQHGNQRSYLVVDFPSLGGSTSAGNSINNLGLAAGYSNLPGNERREAVAWLYGAKIELGTLGGPNSSIVWPVKNNHGMIAGIAETDDLDPLGESWSCSFFFPGGPTGHVCRGFVWERGVMKALRTLGGTHGFATGVNNLGQIVGWAENTVEDPTCNAPQVLQFRAVVWEPRKDQIHELPPLPGDTVTAATAINDRGQVVGISGICDNAVGRFSATSAVLWEDGAVLEIGNLGGVAWHTPMAINNRGDVIGFSNVSEEDGGAFNARAFFWNKRDGIQDLGTLPGDATSQALGINNRGQVVGISCSEGAASCRAFLWEDGGMTDLNTLVGGGYTNRLFFAGDINDYGMITGQAVDETTGEAVPFLAIPIPAGYGGHAGETGPTAQSGQDESSDLILAEGVREELLRRMGLAGLAYH